YGLDAQGFSGEPDNIRDLPFPLVAHWDFDHFLVVDGFRGDSVYLNDPATGPRIVPLSEFDVSFTGVVMTFQPNASFEKRGKPQGVVESLRERLPNSNLALVYLFLAGLGLILPGLLLPIFSRVFVDDILIARRTDWLRPLLVAMVLTAVIQSGLTLLQQRA